MCRTAAALLIGGDGLSTAVFTQTQQTIRRCGIGQGSLARPSTSGYSPTPASQAFNGSASASNGCQPAVRAASRCPSCSSTVGNP